jgi:fatty-acid peroxygenase
VRRTPDGTLGLLRDGYRWASGVCQAAGRDVVRTRLLLRPAVLLRGAALAERFYGPGLVRQGAAPRRLQRTLFGVGGVQGLDGAAHRHRKAVFVSLLAPPRSDALAAVFLGRLRDALPEWERRPEITLFDELGPLLCAAVCEWAGVPLPPADVVPRSTQLEALIAGGASAGPAYRRGVRARHRLERWLSAVVLAVRAGEIRPAEDSALHVLAWHRDLDGALLEPRIAAVELLNVLRPTVAVDRFLVFLALALHLHPAWARRLDDEDAVRRFVLEVRRLTPFFPLVAARAAEPLQLDGQRVSAGTRVLLDLFGTDLDGRTWDEPETFDPDRFLGREPTPFDLVPQGGGDHVDGHRCAGEWVTQALMAATARLLTQEVDYEVPADQDLAVDLRRIPTLPRSGFRITRVRRRDRGT